MGTQTGTGHTERDLRAVFREQEDDTELALYKWLLIFSGASLFLPLFSAFVLQRPLAHLAPFVGVSLVGGTWAAIAFTLRRRRRFVSALRVGTVVVMGAIPWMVMATYVTRFDMPRAITTWEPIILFTAPITLSILWRRPWVPLSLSVVGIGCYLTLWALTIPPSTWDALPSDSPLKPSVTIYRSALLLFVGLFCWRAAHRFNGALLKGARAMRARDLFGKYRLQEPIGRGGMGTVVKALYCPEGGFERPVAIKRVHADLAQSPETVAAFRAEAELGSRLVHPNIVAVLDFGRVEDTYFFAMEYVDGYSLSEIMAIARETKTALPTAFVARLGIEVCAALQYAHEDALDSEGNPLRVVHRDLSPHNILLSRSGQVKLTDFGIARVLGDAEAQQTANVVGKVAYMAPEVIRTNKFDTRADLFSFGVILWELLTGDRLFHRDNPAQAALATYEAIAPPPSIKRPRLHRRWNDICERALAREPDDRIATARELSALLLERLAEEGDPEGDEVRLVVHHLEEAWDDEAPRVELVTDATISDGR